MQAEVVLLVERFPELSQTFIAAEIAALIDAGVAVRVEARVRSQSPNPDVHYAAPVVSYAEDDTRGERLRALPALAARHPLACAADLVARRRWRREEDVSPLRVLAPVARR